MFIRVFSDKYMWEKYVEIENEAPQITDVKCQSNFLYEKIKLKLSKDEKKDLLSAFTIAPSFIHVNSFMFEPLIDVGNEKLVETAKKILSLNYPTN